MMFHYIITYPSDIITIGSLTYPTLPNSDMKFSDIFFQSPDPPHPMY